MKIFAFIFPIVMLSSWATNNNATVFEPSNIKHEDKVTYYSRDNFSPEKINLLLETAKKKQKKKPVFLNNSKVYTNLDTPKKIGEKRNYHAELLIDKSGTVTCVKVYGEKEDIRVYYVYDKCLSRTYNKLKRQKYGYDTIEHEIKLVLDSVKKGEEYVVELQLSFEVPKY